MGAKTILVKGGVVLIVLLFAASFAYAAPTNEDIMKRLEQMEQELKQLKQVNTELRNKIAQESKADLGTKAGPADLNEIQRMVVQDRKDIEELKESAGMASQGMKAVLGKYNMQIYGRVKVDLNYDTAEFRKYNDFIGVVGKGDSGGKGDSSHGSSNFNPRDSRFGLKVARRDDQWLSEARIETDFYGDNNGNNLIPRMRLGYVKVTNDDWKANLTVGQDWIPVAQLNPPTIDFGVMASAGNLWWRVPQITLRKNVGDFEFLVSAMRHRRIDTSENNRIWGLARIAYAGGILGKGGLIALGGGWSQEKLTNTNGTNDVDKWMMALELKYVLGKFTFMAEPWIGEGMDREWLRYDMGINTQALTGPDTIQSKGFWAAVSYKPTYKWAFNTGVGMDDPDNDDMDGMKGFLNDRQFTKNTYVFANTWYALTSAVKMGVEVIRLETERFNKSNKGWRYTFSTMYNF